MPLPIVDRLERNYVARIIRQWVSENLEPLSGVLDPHIDALASFIVTEHEENPDMPPIVVTIIAFFTTLFTKISLPAITATVEAAVAANPTATIELQIGAVIAALQANSTAEFPDATVRSAVAGTLTILAYFLPPPATPAKMAEAPKSLVQVIESVRTAA